MHMHFLSFQSQSYKIEAYVTEKSDRISFDTCFILNSSEMLPKMFKIRDDRIYCKIKLNSYDSVVSRIHCEGRVTFETLKKHLPTVFDTKVIKRYNSQDYWKSNADQIKAISQSIIGEERTNEILKNKN